MPQRGGKREGAGRPKGSRDRATKDQAGTLSELARAFTADALNVLKQVALTGQSESARVSAATAILDRGYGRPSQSLEIGGPNGEPLSVDLTGLLIDEKRALAKIRLAGE